MSDYNMKCIEQLRDHLSLWQVTWIPGWDGGVRLSSFCLMDPDPVTLCDLLVRDAESSLSSFRHDGHSTCISFLGLSKHVVKISEAGFSVELSEEWLIWLQSNALYWRYRISLQICSENNLLLERGNILQRQIKEKLLWNSRVCECACKICSCFLAINIIY